jgi:hypothetical protein
MATKPNVLRVNIMLLQLGHSSSMRMKRRRLTITTWEAQVK